MGMKVIVINCGSSSLKYQLFDMNNEQVLAKGVVERIGMDSAIVSYLATGKEPVKEVCEILDHKEALRHVLTLLLDQKVGVIKDVSEIAAVGHRVVHGGEDIIDAVLITDKIKQTIRETIDLAPLHNPANLKGIIAFEELLGAKVPMVGVFDTAFHHTIPKENYMYAIPMVLYKRHKIRRYGFHGTSHKYVSSKLEEITNQSNLNKKIISCHIGNGASITAIKDGKSYDTSMGMTTLEGLIMGTRSGDIDPGIITYIMNKEDLTIHEVNSMLNKHSGLVGVSGLSSDLRDIIQGMKEGHTGATLAYNMYIQRIRKYIGAYAAEMNGVDTIIFTGGVGENSALVRKDVCDGFSFIGLQLDEERNQVESNVERRISSDDSRVEVYVIPTNEELMIARDTVRIIQESQIN